MSAIFLLLNLLTWAECTLAAEISECETKRNISFVLSGNDLDICCDLSEEECNRTLEENLMQLLPERGILKSSPSQARCTARLLIANASKEDSASYICRNNTSVFSIINITVLDKPSIPQFTSIKASEESDIIVEFDPGPQNSLCYYSVSLENDYSTKILCQLNCTDQNGDILKNCVCIFDNSDQFYFIFRNDVTLVIGVFVLSPIGPISSWEVKKTICLLDHFVPGCVLDFLTLNVTEDRASIQFRPAKKTARLIDFLKERGKKFSYYVELWKLDGKPQLLKMQFEKKILFDIDFDMISSEIQYAAIEFDELNIFTTYSILVTGVADNTAGCTRNITFTTKPSVPASSPEIEDFLFSRFTTETNLSSLWLMWRPLAQESKGGNNVSYLVAEVGASQKLPLNTSQNYITISELPTAASTFHIWSVNELGQSRNFTEVKFPNDTGIAEYSIIAESVNDTHVLLVVDVFSTANIQAIAIHACKGDRIPGSITQDACLEYPHTKMFDTAYLQQSPLELFFFIPASKPKITQNQKNVTYFEYQDQKQMYNRRNTVQANVTLNQNEFISSSHTDPFLNLRDLNSIDERRKRSAELILPYTGNDQHRKRSAGLILPYAGNDQHRKRSAELILPYTGNDQHRKRSAELILPYAGNDQPSLLSLKTLGDSLRFFISLKTGGKWLGMKPSKCYFNRESASTNVIVVQENGFVKISQVCDTVTPKQFLVYSYQIYSASGVECAENEKSSGTTTMIIIIVVVGTILVCVALIVICFICRCRRRRKYFYKMTMTSKKLSDSIPAVYEDIDFTVRPTKVIDQSSSDSGHGTFNESENISQSISYSHRSEILEDYQQPNSSLRGICFAGSGPSHPPPPSGYGSVSDPSSASFDNVIDFNGTSDSASEKIGKEIINSVEGAIFSDSGNSNPDSHEDRRCSSSPDSVEVNDSPDESNSESESNYENGSVNNDPNNQITTIAIQT
ncbi:hypothetical protein Btru_039574 [Bulinus truncatus]|nr:hypothetical protein Btru_039574 [Bulinus truncatus]